MNILLRGFCIYRSSTPCSTWRIALANWRTCGRISIADDSSIWALLISLLNSESGVPGRLLGGVSKAVKYK